MHLEWQTLPQAGSGLYLATEPVSCYSMHSLGSHPRFACFVWSREILENLSKRSFSRFSRTFPYINPPLANNIYNSAHKLTPLPDRSALPTPFIEMNIFPRGNLAKCTFKQLKHRSEIVALPCIPGDSWKMRVVLG